jgi:hypothetical protein
MTSEEVVAAFVDWLLTALAALRSQFDAAARPGPAEPLFLFPRVGGPGRRVGLLPGVGSYQVHGIGCLVEFASGERVDFDWDEDARVVFDAWRLSNFANSIGQTALGRVELEAAARTDQALVEVRPGWFTLASSPQGM